VRAAAEEGGGARDQAARDGVAAAGELAVVGQRLAHPHRDGGADRGGDADEQGGVRAGGVGRGEDRRERGDRPVDQADEGRLHDLEHAVALRLAAPGADDGGDGRHAQEFIKSLLR